MPSSTVPPRSMRTSRPTSSRPSRPCPGVPSPSPSGAGQPTLWRHGLMLEGFGPVTSCASCLVPQSTSPSCTTPASGSVRSRQGSTPGWGRPNATASSIACCPSSRSSRMISSASLARAQGSSSLEVSSPWSPRRLGRRVTDPRPAIRWRWCGPQGRPGCRRERSSTTGRWRRWRQAPTCSVRLAIAGSLRCPSPMSATSPVPGMRSHTE